MKLVSLTLALFAVVCLASPEIERQQRFLEFMQTHGKNYAASEMMYRYNVFSKNVAMIEEHNAAGNHSWTLGVNQFADLTAVEFERIHLGFLPRNDVRHEVEVDTSLAEFASSVDWSTQGAVTPVKDQGQCGSCWAFSTTGSIEGVNFLATCTLQSFSESQLVDCAGSYGNQGCNGGLMDNAFAYVEAKGLATESAYPYSPRDGTCRSATAAVKISGYTDVGTNEAALVTAIQKNPVSIAVDARTWQFYSSGIYSGCSSSVELDHGVLAVGFDDSSFKVKNSWATSWGESGYIRLARGKNMCGLTNAASYPTA